MPQATNAIVDNAWQEGDNLRWMTFGVMTVSGMMVMVVGNAAQDDSGLDWKFFAFYSAWILATVFFLYLNKKTTKVFVVHSLLHLACIGLILWFLYHILQVAADSMPLYIPASVNLGIFLGIGLDHLWSRPRGGIRNILHDIISSLTQTLYDISSSLSHTVHEIASSMAQIFQGDEVDEARDHLLQQGALEENLVTDERDTLPQDGEPMFVIE